MACLMHFMSQQCGDLEFLWLWEPRGISSCHSSAADKPPSSTEQRGSSVNILNITEHPEDGSDTCFSPRKVLVHEAETAGAVMAFFLSLGLALGAAVSFLVRLLI